MIRKLTLAAALAPLASPAFAHLPPGEYGSFAAGFSHPLFGLDHVLAMVAVGLWAAQIGERALWAVPAAFVLTMAGGYGLALAGASLPFVEPMVLASVVALGLLVALAVRPHAALGALVVGTFALFHGHAHGGELGAAGAVPFGLGFALATALLHGAGIALGMGVGGPRLGLGSRLGDAIARASGAAAAAAGLLLMVG